MLLLLAPPARVQVKLSNTSQTDSILNIKTQIDVDVEQTLDSIGKSENLNQHRRSADLYNSLGKLYLRKADYPEAFECFFKSLNIRQQEKFSEDSEYGNTFALLGESFRAVSKYEDAIQYLNSANAVYRKLNDANGICLIHNRFASVYYEIAVNRLDSSYLIKAENEALKSLELSLSAGNKQMMISNYNILGAIYNNRYLTDKAREYLFLALETAESIPNYKDAPNIINNIASSYFLDGNYEKTIEYCERSEKEALASGTKIYRVEAQRLLMETYHSLGDHEKAFDYLWLFYTSWKTIFNEKMESDVNTLKKKYDLEIEKQIQTVRNTRMWTIIIVSVLIIAAIGVVILVRIRDVHRMNRNLALQHETISKQKADLEELIGTRNRFFSILSHDLRNPLNGINGFSHLLSLDYDNYTDDVRKEYIGYIKDSSESMYKVIDKVLTWSRLQSNSIKSHREEFDLSDAAENALNLQKPSASRKKIALENSVLKGTVVYSDRSFVDTLLTNLVDNAVKFTGDGGSITVYSELKDNRIEVSVKDTGKGMSEEIRSQILRSNSSFTTRGTRNEKGSGLGLMICIDMLEILGSKLNIESKPGEGTRFFFTLDLPVLQ